MEPRSIGGLMRLARDPREVLWFVRGNPELWANLFIISWAVAFTLWQGVGFAITVGTVFAIWAILAVSLNLVVGFTGLLSVGHIGFFGIGAYAMAFLTSDAAYEQLRTEAIPTPGWPFFAALPVSIALAGLVALVVGVVFNRFRDDIYVLVSFGFAIISFNVFLNWRSLTRGAFGIHEIAKPEIGGITLRWRIGVSRPIPGIPRGRDADRLVHCDFVIRTSPHRDPRGRAGGRGLWLPGNPLQTCDMGHLSHDGGVSGRSFRQLDLLHRPQFLRSPGVNPPGVHRNPGRVGHHLGFPTWRNGLRSSGRRDALCAVPTD